MRKPAGFGLLDTLLALAVIAGALVLSIRYYRITTEQQKINQTLVQMQQIMTAVSGALNAANTGAAGADIAHSIWSTSTNLGGTLMNNNLLNKAAVLSPWNRQILKISLNSNTAVYGSCNGTTTTQPTCNALRIQILNVPPSALPKLQSSFCSKFRDNFPSYDNNSTYSVCL